MSTKISRGLLLGSFLWLVGVTFWGCGSPTEINFKDGRLYFVNNTRPSGGDRISAIFEGNLTEIDFNMTSDGALTGAGAVEISGGPLAGGTKFDKADKMVGCKFWQQGDNFETYITVTIDGNVTVEAYETDWNAWESNIGLRVHRGIFNGGDPAVASGR